MPTGGHVPWTEEPDVFFPAVESLLRGGVADPARVRRDLWPTHG